MGLRFDQQQSALYDLTAKRAEQWEERPRSAKYWCIFFQHPCIIGPVATRSPLGYLTARAKEIGLKEDVSLEKRGPSWGYLPSAGERGTWRDNRDGRIGNTGRSIITWKHVPGPDSIAMLPGC